MSISGTLAIARKRLRHICCRDRYILSVTVIAPLVVLFLLVYTFAADLQLTGIGGLDWDQSSPSRRYLANLTSGGFVKVTVAVKDSSATMRLLVSDSVDVVLVIPPGSKEYYKEEEAPSIAAATSCFGPLQLRTGVCCGPIGRYQGCSARPGFRRLRPAIHNAEAKLYSYFRVFQFYLTKGIEPVEIAHPGWRPTLLS